ncbi:MAG: exosome subunit [Cenarchaeum symbiont of Oopsacas minuta]|nr:exosome subunit [Cenarchaeum symbiont of Oopsacas minuta]
MTVQVTIEIIIHATEDISKFYDSIKTIFDCDSDCISETSTTGHYGNTITILCITVKKRNAKKIVRVILDGLGSFDISNIISEIGSRLTESGLCLRLDKQEFVQGRLTLGDGGAIRVRIYTPVYVKRDTESEYMALLSA